MEFIGESETFKISGKYFHFEDIMRKFSRISWNLCHFWKFKKCQTLRI